VDVLGGVQICQRRIELEPHIEPNESNECLVPQSGADAVAQVARIRRALVDLTEIEKQGRTPRWPEAGEGETQLDVAGELRETAQFLVASARSLNLPVIVDEDTVGAGYDRTNLPKCPPSHVVRSARIEANAVEAILKDRLVEL